MNAFFHQSERHIVIRLILNYYDYMDENKDYKYYLNYGIELTNKGKFEEAIDEFDKSLEIKSDSALTYFSKGIAYHNLNKLEDAYECYTKAIDCNPQMIDAYYNRAQVILAYDSPTDDELKSALSDLQKAVELDAKFIDAYYYAAVVQKKLGEYKAAITSLDKVIALQPDAVHSRALKKLILQKYLK